MLRTLKVRKYISIVSHHTFASQSFYANPLQSKVSMHPGKNHPSNPVLLSSFKKKYIFFLWESQKERRKRRKKKINSISSSILKYFYHILPWSSYTMIQLVSSISFLVYVLLLLECTAQCANSINRLNEPELSWNASWLSSFDNVYNSAFEHVGCQKGNKQMWEIHQVHP